MKVQPSVHMAYIRPSWTSLHPHTPTPPPAPPPSSPPSSVNENARLYLERADVTSGLSDEPITVGVGLCDSLTNPGLLQWLGSAGYWLTQQKVSTPSILGASFVFYTELRLSLVHGLLQEMDSVFVCITIVFLEMWIGDFAKPKALFRQPKGIQKTPNMSCCI